MNVNEAKEILRKSELPITPADEFGEAAKKVVQSIC